MNKTRIYCLLLCSVLSVATLVAQSTAEYFIDHDPGFRKAIKVSINADAAQVDVPTSGLAAGWHILGLRAISSRTSQTYLHRFFIPEQTQTTVLSDVEYFIDSDPGQNNATKVPVTAGQTEVAMDAVIPEDLSEGLHVIGIRAKYKSGWSQTYTHLFLHTVAQEVQTIVEAVEAFWDEDTTQIIAIPFEQKGDTAYIKGYDFDTKDLTVGTHYLNLYAKVNGVMTIIYRYEITVQEQSGGETAIDNPDAENKLQKILRNDRVIIIHKDKIYTIQGQKVK